MPPAHPWMARVPVGMHFCHLSSWEDPLPCRTVVTSWAEPFAPKAHTAGACSHFPYNPPPSSPEEEGEAFPECSGAQQLDKAREGHFTRKNQRRQGTSPQNGTLCPEDSKRGHRGARLCVISNTNVHNLERIYWGKCSVIIKCSTEAIFCYDTLQGCFET